MRHRFLALPLAVLASLALASVALAGGWAQVTVQDAPVDPPAGGETIINLNVLQHGVTPVSWPHLTVLARNFTSGAQVQAEAQAKGPEGSYVATMVFPSAGDWVLTFDSPELDMSDSSAALNVPPAVAAVAATGLAAAAPAASTFDATPLLLLLAAAVALAVGGLVVRNVRASGATRVSVRT